MRKISAVAVAVGICFIILIIGGLPQLSHASAIYGCVLKGGYGLLRIVSNPSQCNRSETAISWNQVGPSGPKGDTGATGATGSQGTAGANGHSPVVSVSGDQITVDGVITGPHLTGPQGPAGTGGGVDGMSRVVMGRVDGEGNVIVWASGAGFTVVKSTDGPGIYVINFTTPFNMMPICVCSLMGANPLYGGPATCEIPFDPMGPFEVQQWVIIRDSNGNTTDGAFTFMCAEP